MAGDFPYGLSVVIILCVDAVLLLGPDAAHHAERPVKAAQFRTAAGIVGDLLGQDILCTGQSGGGIRNLIIQIAGRLGRRVKPGVLFQNRLRQRFQPPCPGNAGPGPAFGLVGPVDILHLGQCSGIVQTFLQFGGHGVLLRDAAGDLLPAGIQSAQVVQALAQAAKHLVVHGAGGLLAVPGNERNGIALINQLNSTLHMLGIQRKLLRKLLNVGGWG